MLIKPSLRSNFFTNAHPIGIKKNIENLIDEVKVFQVLTDFLSDLLFF